MENLGIKAKGKTRKRGEGGSRILNWRIIYNFSKIFVEIKNKVIRRSFYVPGISASKTRKFRNHLI